VVSALRAYATPLLALALALALFVSLPPAQAQSTAEGDHIVVRWLAPVQLTADEPALLAFHFSIAPDWHVYWRNPGDSGAAPRFDITSEGASIGAIQWPVPKRLPIAHLTNIGYEDTVAYLFEIRPEPGAQRVRLDVDLEWLVCEVDCIPGFGRMSLDVPVGAETVWDVEDEATLADFYTKLPRSSESAPWRMEGMERGDDGALTLTVRATGAAPERAPDVFPLDNTLIAAGAPAIEQADSTFRYRLPAEPSAATASQTGFLLSDGDGAWYFDEVPIGRALPAALASLWALLLAAFAGGVILNLMPCVFPVLSIKVFALVRQPDGTLDSARARLREGSLYSAGVLLTFAALGAALLALRATGAAVGWGFQLQSAPVVLALIVLFWLMALAFSGAFEFGHRLMNLAGNTRHSSSFMTGVLAVFVAAPCTGPFMGVALGAAAVLPAPAAMAIFLTLGAGMAAPLFALTVTPALLRRLPRPGPWMDRLRQFLAFPLYATVLWLLWVLGRLIGEDGWLVGGAVLLGISFAIWLAQTLRGRWRLVGPATALALALAAFTSLDGETPDAAATAGSAWQPFDRTVIAEARAQGQPVFIDFTAAWCITCQVNKARVLETAAVERLFDAHHVLRVRADWTRHDPAITEALAALGRNSVPVYAWYPPGADTPQLLPQILQEGTIADLFTELAVVAETPTL